MTDNAPTTGKVRLDFAYLGGISDEDEYDLRIQQFDRWLAAARAAAWDEGMKSWLSSSPVWPPSNPYRRASND